MLRIVRRHWSSLSATPDSHQLQVACIIHRNPVCMKPPSSFESAYSDYRLALQFEQSRGLLRIQPVSQAPTEQEVAAAKAPTAEAQIAALTKGIEPFNAKQHLHQHDAYYAQQTGVKRELHRKIYLIVKDPLTGEWTVPRVEADRSKAMHLQAHSLAQSVCGEEARLYVPGRAPVAYHCEPWMDRGKAPWGAKLFFWRAELYSGHFKPLIDQHAWVTKEEMSSKVSASLYQSIRHCLAE